MPPKHHTYRLTVTWTGNRGRGTENYAAYGREHEIAAPGKTPIPGSADPAFRGDPARWNPEELLLASLCACHKLWYLHLCASAGISVLDYRDEAEAIMAETADGAGRLISATLRPRVTLRAGDDLEAAGRLHRDAHRFCFIANSVNFPVGCEPVLRHA